MSNVMFNTMQTLKLAKERGMKAEDAENMLFLVEEVMNAKVASKDDLQVTESKLKVEIATTKADLSAEIAEVEKRLTNRFYLAFGSSTALTLMGFFYLSRLIIQMGS